MDLELVPGPQSVRLELGPRYAIRFEFRENEEAPPPGDEFYYGAIPSVRAVEHGGQVTRNWWWNNREIEVSAPGVCEVSFEGVGEDRFHPIPPRLVDVRPGETTEVIVELHRK